ncbi:MAG: ImmA/IrrE family metallo-endopeptidase [Peptococcaceae bacterium]|jgi:Zn-dependent peptidase ImmA (M78 family)|nr:ImmA/IrrE family metallo-endopeptidase [Peptococcaceae bacterium]MDH7525251.1 ImmA/IrrE family metallo-endopeptidase [Peptococcaceae bacterium]
MYETLLEEAAKEQIEIAYLPLKDRLKGLYGDNVIAINSNINTTAEKACILAEELGHYHTTVGDILDQTKLNNKKQEKRAHVWAYKRLVPLDKLISAYEARVMNRFELAEYLGVTEDFLNKAIDYYKEKYGLYYRIRDYFICFEPLMIIEAFNDKKFLP